MVAEILAAADIGLKASNVTATELWGNCPQHIQTIAFVGPVEAVRQVERALREGGRIA
jgi:microcompartment protein CcmL/EutN